MADANPYRSAEEMLGGFSPTEIGGKISPTNVGGLRKLLKTKEAKVGIGSLIAYMVLGRILEEGNKWAERGVQREAITGQAELVTPESLYAEAALPTAREEEMQARQALYTQILQGGVTGPSLAKGERLI